MTVIPFTPLSGRALVEQAREARAVPRPRQPRSLGALPRHERIRAVGGVAEAMLSEARAIFSLIAAGRTADGPLSEQDVRDLAAFGLQQTNTGVILAMIDDLEALHGR